MIGVPSIARTAFAAARAFGGKLATSQVWQLVAYIRSMSGLLAKDVAPGREDALYGAPQEQSTSEQRPVESSRPPQAEQP